MWALRRASLPLWNRGFNGRASCLKSVSATWVENDSSMLESSRMAYGRSLLPNMFYHSESAAVKKFIASRCKLPWQTYGKLETPAAASKSGKDGSNDIEDGEVELNEILERHYSFLVHKIEFLVIDYLEAHPHEVDKVWNMKCLAVIEGLVELGKIDDAEAVFDMMLMRWKITPKSCSIMLKICADNKMLAKGKDLIEKMIHAGYPICPLTWDCLVKLYIQAGEVEEADTVMERAILQGQLKPLMRSYLAIMYQYANRGDVQNSEKIVGKMRQAGYMLHRWPCQVLLWAYIQAKLPGDQIWFKMKYNFPDLYVEEIKRYFYKGCFYSTLLV